MIELYDFELSGNCHKVRLLLSLLGVNYKSHALNLSAREQKSPEFLAVNPFGQVPALTDDGVVIRDSQAILVYLARAYGADVWFPVDAKKSAEIMEWLSTAANEVSRGPAALRRHYKFGNEINVDEAGKITANVLQVLNNHLAKNMWLATGRVTIADIAIYPYIALANEGNVDLTSFIHITNWMGRIETLSGFVTMPGITVSGIAVCEYKVERIVNKLFMRVNNV